MKTKIILLAALFIGFSLSSFSQEEITIKQVIKNSSTNASSYGDAIKVIKIWTDIPVIIKSGKENAIYLTGDIKANEKDKISSFCVLKNNLFEISSPYLFLDEENKSKDFGNFKITLELADNVYTYLLRSNANLTIEKSIISDMNGIFNLGEKSKLTLVGEVKFGVININAQENSNIRFNSIDVQEVLLTMGKNSTIDFNGEIRSIEIMDQGEGAKLIGNYKFTSMERHNVDINDDNYFSRRLTGRPKVKDNTISISDTTVEKDFNQLSNACIPDNANIIIGKNSKAKIIFSDNLKTDYTSNYPIKGYENGKLIIQDDYPFELELTIRKDIGNITLEDGAKVIIDSEIKEESRSYYLHNNAELIFNYNVEVNKLGIHLNNASKIRFKQLKTDNLFLQGDGTSELEINGEIGLLDRYKYDDVNLKGDHKIGSIKERKIKALTVAANIPLDIKTEPIKGDQNSEKIKAQNLGKDKVSFGLTFGYGVLNWSNGVNKVDDLFSSPNNEYKLRMGDSWNFGLKFRYNINSKLRLYTGIGIESNVFRFENNVKITETNGDKRLAYETDPLIFNSKSNICARYFTIPIHIQYFFYKKFSIHAGGILGINYRNSSTGFERKYDIPHAKITEEWGKNYDNFKPLKLDLQAGFGWSSVNFYLKYSLTPIFKDNKEMVLYPYSVGISLGI